jgi:hypothetical protein
MSGISPLTPKGGTWKGFLLLQEKKFMNRHGHILRQAGKILFLFVFFIYGSLTGCGPDPEPSPPGSTDSTAPVPGNGGILAISDVTESSLTLSWTAASDNSTALSDIRYLAYYSESPLMTSVSEIETNGTPAGSYQTGIESTPVTDLTAETTYYFNVIAKDRKDNKAAYTMKKGIPEITPPVPGAGGITVDIITATTVILSWDAASDTGTIDPSELLYRVYYSTTNNIDTKNNVLNNGTPAGDWQENNLSLKVSGLNRAGNYYFNVLVKDISGNIAADTMTLEQTTAVAFTWFFVDGNGVSGINKDPARDALLPCLAVFNSKLYATWRESNGTANQIRVVLYNGNDSSPSWTFIDGNGTTGINKVGTDYANSPQLAVYNSKLYAVWNEYHNSRYQIRVALYNGNDSSPAWSFVDGNGENGLNKDVTRNADSPRLCVFNSKLYAIWGESNGTVNQIRAVVYNGNDSLPAWSFIDGNGVNGINKDTAQTAQVPHLGVCNSKLYATWRETYGTINQTRVALYNGNDSSPIWSFVDGNGAAGLNKNTGQHASYQQLYPFNGKLYATWGENDGINNYQIRTLVYNGNDSSPAWNFLDGNGVTGINKDVTKNASFPNLSVFGSELYVFWGELYGGFSQIRAALYNGNDSLPAWSFVDGNLATGLNKDTGKNAINQQGVEFNSKIYMIWSEANQIRVIAGE